MPPQKDLRTIGQRIRYMRQRRGLTQPELAQACRCHWKSIGRIESDQNELHAFLFMEIGRALNVSLDWLTFGELGQSRKEAA